MTQFIAGNFYVSNYSHLEGGFRDRRWASTKEFIVFFTGRQRYGDYVVQFFSADKSKYIISNGIYREQDGWNVIPENNLREVEIKDLIRNDRIYLWDEFPTAAEFFRNKLNEWFVDVPVPNIAPEVKKDTTKVVIKENAFKPKHGPQADFFATKLEYPKSLVRYL